MEFQSKRLRFQELTREDLPEYHRFCSLPEIREFSTLSIPEDQSESAERLAALIDQQANAPRKKYSWKISHRETGSFIGLAGISLSLDQFKLGIIFYEVDPLYWGNGYATEIAKRLIKTGFEDFHLHKVEAGVATQNIRSIRVLEKSGMVREGQRRKILPIRGQWVDNYLYAIVEDDPWE